MKTRLLVLLGLFGTVLLFAVLLNHQSVKADALGPNLVGNWTFNSAQVVSTTATDSSGQGNSGTLVAAPTLTNGKLAQALSFNGSTQYVTILVNKAVASVPAAFANIANANSYSFSAWIKTSNAAAIGATAPWAQGNTIIEARGTASFTGAWSFGTESGKLATGRCNAATCAAGRVTTVATVNDNKWHFVVATVNVNAVSFYIDGKLSSTATFTDAASIGDCSVGKVGNTNTYMQIGARTTNAAGYANFFSGQLDDVRLYNAALTASDVQAAYYQGLGLQNRAV